MIVEKRNTVQLVPPTTDSLYEDADEIISDEMFGENRKIRFSYKGERYEIIWDSRWFAGELIDTSKFLELEYKIGYKYTENQNESK